MDINSLSREELTATLYVVTANLAAYMIKDLAYVDKYREIVKSFNGNVDDASASIMNGILKEAVEIVKQTGLK